MSETRININTADEETLISLPGIAAGLAKQIIFYRENVHPFEETIELAAVRGISERMVRELDDQITVGDVAKSTLNGAVAHVVEIETEETSSVEEVNTEEVVEEDSTDEENAGNEDISEADEAIEDEPEIESEAETDELDDADGISLEVSPPEETVAVVAAVAPASFSPPMGIDKPSPFFEDAPDEPTNTAAAPPAPPASVATGEAGSDGFNWFSAIIGGIIGVLLAVAVMFILNGSLRFANQERFNDLNQTVRQQQATIDALSAQLAELNLSTSSLEEESTGRLNALDTGLNTLSGSMAETNGQVDTLSNDFSAAQASTEANLNALTETNALMAEQIGAVAASAETFDSFLNNMRDFLNGLEGDVDGAPDGDAEVVPATGEEADDADQEADQIEESGEAAEDGVMTEDTDAMIEEEDTGENSDATTEEAPAEDAEDMTEEEGTGEDSTATTEEENADDASDATTEEESVDDASEPTSDESEEGADDATDESEESSDNG